MTLFNIEQYQKSYQRDWDGAIYDPTWDELDDITETPQNKVSAVVEVKSDEISDCWNPAHFGEVPRKADETGNPTIFWDESIEPPDPDDFESNLEYEEAWQQWQNSDSLICAAEWEQDLLSPDCISPDLNLSDSLKSMNTAAIASQNSTQEFTTTEMLMPLRENGSLKEESIYSVVRHPVSPSQFKENEKLPTIKEIAFPQSLESLEATNQNTSASKMLEDYSTVPTPPDTTLSISSGSLLSFTAAGTMQNGYVLVQEPLPAPLIEEDCCWLPAPTALSTKGSRPPGLSKLETFLKNNELIDKGEVLNPVILCEWFGIPSTWLDPSESRTAAELLENNAAPLETFLIPELPRSPSGEYSTSTHSAPVKEPAGEYSTTLKAISLWQPWASLIPLGLKHYETRSWKTNYRGKLLICSTAANSKQHKEYLKICDELQLPPWENFLHGCAIALCDLVDCIEMTPEFIAQQSQTEIKSGEWQVGRYAWKLENIQAITEPFAVKGKQGLFDIPSTNLECYLKQNFIPTHKLKKVQKKSSDCWYTPPHIIELIIQVLGQIDLDPCADDGKHIPARSHYTFNDDGLVQPWHGQIYMNPPYSHPGAWIEKLQLEVTAGNVKESIALVPAATDTKWLSPVLKTQPVCFWTGRIKFLNEDYQPKSSARQSHVLVYWGENWERFRDVFEEYGFVSVPSQFLGDKLDDEISPRKISEDEKFLGDKLDDEISPRKISEDEKFLGDKLDDEISPRKISEDEKFLGDKLDDDISPRKTGEDEKFLGDKLDDEISPRKISEDEKFLGDKLDDDISPRKTGEDEKFLGDKLDDEISPLKTRRRKGDGSGSIHYRTVTKKCKEYREAYYHYEFWSGGDRLVKSSKYIPKRLLPQVQQLEVEKASVREILRMLGIYF